MEIGAIIQARTGSSRLPQKILKELPYKSNITVLQQVIRRVKLSQKIDKIIVATTFNKNDEIIADIALKEKVDVFKGSENDVLERYYLCAKEKKLDYIVRITSDCPCIDWEIIDIVIEKHLKLNADYTTNTLELTYPQGLDVEVASFSALEKAYKEATKDFEREHVFPYIYISQKEKFRIASVKADQKLFAPDIRITLDTEEDYVLLCSIFDNLYWQNKMFTAKDIIYLFKQKPWLKHINKKVLQKKIYNSLEEEIEDAKKLLTFQNLENVKKLLEQCL